MALALALGLALPAYATHAQGIAPDTVEAHLAAGKRAVGGRDGTPEFYGLVTALCVAPQRGAPRPDAPAPREEPDRKTAISNRRRRSTTSTGWARAASRHGC